MKNLLAVVMGLLFLSATGMAIADKGTSTGNKGGNIAAVNLGSAASFVVLASTTITNINPTTLCGDLGLSPGSAVVGAPVLSCGGVAHITDSTAAKAQRDLTIAYNDAAGRTSPTKVAGNLGGQTLVPGLYKSTSSLEISSGDLTLDAKGNSNGVFIFQIASTLTTTPGRKVILAGGAKAANVFWQVGSMCSLDTTTVFKGTIMAHEQITLNTGAVLEGRALSQIAQVTMLSNTITKP
ncbi:MAG TPA: ice-binding family protein [bacterium]